MGGILSRIVTTGTINCMGVFLDDLKKAFSSSSTAQISLVFSVAPALLEGTGVLASFLMSKIKARYLVIIGSIVATIGVLMASQTHTYLVLLLGMGIMNGMGQGLARCILPIAITFSFDDKTRHIAFAILNGGDGVGGVLGPILFSYLIETFTWRNALLVVAGMTAHLTVSGCTVPLTLTATNVEREKRKMSTTQTHQRKISTTVHSESEQRFAVTAASTSDRSASGSPSVEIGAEEEQKDQDMIDEPDVPLFPNAIFFLSNIITHSIAYFIFMTFVYSDMKDQNMAPGTVSLIVAIIGGVSIIGRVSICVMTNKVIPRWVIYMSGHIIRSLVVLCFQIPLPNDGGSTKTVIYAILCALYGLTDGVTGSLIPLICVDLFGLKRFGLVLGLEMFLMGLGAVVGVPLAGLMKDYFKSYQIPFLFSACSFMVAGLVLVPLFWTKKRYQMVSKVDKKSRLAERKFSL
uniref:Major facilitator superfamily (MFS) profile domain-containing protein n=1 Tax=Romanomermis culicivorax TaxID=13658 RepID=A0A915KER3_ROMCU